MSYDFVGLENLPNVYIEKIIISDNNNQSDLVDVRILMLDEIFDNSFVWSSDPLIYDYLKVAIIATSDELLINRISKGTLNPHPSLLRDRRKTQILTTSPKQTQITSDTNSKRYSQTLSFVMPKSTSNMTLFAFTYIDTQELSNSLRIALTGPLRHYMGSVTSEHILVDGSIQRLTFQYKTKADNKVWSGPVHQKRVSGEFMGGSYHSNVPHPALIQNVVNNTKINDDRTPVLAARNEITMPPKTMFSNLDNCFNDEADFIGMFSIDLRSMILTKTKFGRKMFNVSRDLFESFAKSISINSIEVRRQQIKLKAFSNRLGTRKYSDDLIGPYRTIGATVESNGSLVNTNSLSQIYIVPDKLVRTYQFIDEEMTEKTRGEFRYEAIVSFQDKSQEFLHNLIMQMERNISDLRTQQEFLFRPVRYDRANNKLKKGYTVPLIFNSSIENYFDNLSIISKIDDEQKSNLIKNKKYSFTEDNYTDSKCSKFISDYSALVTELRNKFDLKDRKYRLAGAKKASRSTPPGFIVVNYKFEDVVKFDKVVASYDYLGIKSNKSLATFTKDNYLSRADLEVNRFFNTQRSTISNDLSDLEKEDMIALKDLDSAKTGFFSPLSFKFKSESKDLTSLDNLDTDGITSNFISHITKKQSDNRFSSAPIKRQKKTKPRRRKRKTRKTFRKTRVGKLKFNFKRSPIKINNLKLDDHLGVSKYLGPNSEMVNIESKLEQPTIALQQSQIESKLIATQGIGVKREKISFDLRAKNNIFEKFKSSPKFDRKKLRMMPISIKALFNSRSNAAKNNILESETDILKEAETKISTEMIFHASQRIEYFAGFSTDINGLPDVSQPNWEEVTPIALENNSRLMCRMRYTEVPELDIQPAEELKLLALNSTFVISDGPITTEMLPNTPTTALEEFLELPIVNDIVYASSNFVKQSESRKNQLINETSVTAIINNQPPLGGTQYAQTSIY